MWNTLTAQWRETGRDGEGEGEMWGGHTQAKASRPGTGIWTGSPIRDKLWSSVTLWIKLLTVDGFLKLRLEERVEIPYIWLLNSNVAAYEIEIIRMVWWQGCLEIWTGDFLIEHGKCWKSGSVFWQRGFESIPIWEGSLVFVLTVAEKSAFCVHNGSHFL